MTTDAILVASALRKEYPLEHGGAPFVAVDDVSFEVTRGRCLGIVGESGSGKTTTAKLLMGIEAPTSGSIVVAGRDRSGVARSLAERRVRAREVQLVFQDPYTSLDPRQSAAAMLDEIQRLHFGGRDASERARRTADLGRQVGLDDRQLAAKPSALSGGQRQRVAIARALCAEPQVVVFDEAVSGLDVSIQAEILNLLADIQRDTGMTYVFISHDLGVIRQVADDVVVMRHGAVVERGSTTTVLDEPSADYTRELLAAVPGPGWVPRGS